MATVDEKQLLELILKELGQGERAFFDDLTQSEKDFVLGMLRDFRDGDGGCPTLDLLWEVDYTEPPVDIRTFIENEYYLGLTVGERNDDDIFPTWAEVMEELFDPDTNIWEFLLSGSIGTGKTTAAALAFVFKIYQLSCLRNPQRFYGLLPDHPIVFGLYNVFKYKVRTTSFAYVEAFVNSSPYFRERFPRDIRKTSELVFPRAVRVLHGASDLHALGENLFAVMIDETDFMKAGATDEDRGQAYKLYTATMRRMESRFMQKGGDIPGILIMISSKTSKGSFIEQRIEDKGKDPKTLVADKTLWEVKPWRYGEARFPVFVGDQYHDPRLLTEEEAEGLKGKVVWVPVEHTLAFKEDLEGALRDIAGVATVTDVPFIPSREHIHGCIDKEREHPFTKMDFSITIADPTPVEDYFKHRSMLRVSSSQFTPRVRPGVRRYIHLDLGVTGDSVGFAMGHIAGMKVVKRAVTDPEAEGFEYETRVPLIYIDLILRIVPTPGTRIDFQKVRDFIYALRGYGFGIALVTLDGWQSEDSMQQFIKQGFESEILSMDRLPKDKEGHPYSYLRQAILEDRISYYAHPMFLTETINLQRIILATTTAQNPRNRWKVDHPPLMLNLDGHKVRGSKDTADAVGGVVRHCMVLDPAAQESALPSRGLPAEGRRSHGYAPPRPTFIQDEEWLLDDYGDVSRIRGMQP